MLPATIARFLRLAAKHIFLFASVHIRSYTAEKFMGDVAGMINSKRGAIEAMGERGVARVITAKVPLSEMFGLSAVALPCPSVASAKEERRWASPCNCAP